ncbi:MAG: dTMP kinase [Myxococcota bacterium]|nr:dTMP kinase [Myxococcota bacterium]
MSVRGRFVVLEGIDGAGTTTQVAMLAERLRASRVPVRATREPSEGPLGALARQVLSGRLVMPGGRAPGWMTMALLFAADRMDHVESAIDPFLSEGGIVVSDRYDASSLAYQSVSSGASPKEALDWIRTLNRYARRPDLTVVLDVAAEEAAERRRRRGEAAQLYEQNETQGALASFYDQLAEHMPHDRVVHVCGVGTIEEVHSRVWAAYQQMHDGEARTS